MAKGRVTVYGQSQNKLAHRKFKNLYERDKFILLFTKKYPGATVIPLVISEKQIMTHPGNSKEESATIINWFGSITGHIADKLCERLFHCTASEVTKDQIAIMWHELGRPRKYKQESIISFINS